MLLKNKPTAQRRGLSKGLAETVGGRPLEQRLQFLTLRKTLYHFAPRITIKSPSTPVSR